MNLRRVKFKDIEQIPHLQVNTNFKVNFQGSSPAPFIGRYGYPHVNVWLLSPQYSGDMNLYDSPRTWSQINTTLGTVASKRYSLVNSRMKGSVKKISGRLMDIIQEVGMAKRQSEVEVNLKKKPDLHMKPEKEIKPFGPQVEMIKARVTENTKIDTRVERVVTDTDLKAAAGIVSLYKKGFEENSVHKLLSVGSMGIGKNRKLVPTRWSITATDDTIGKGLIGDLQQLQSGGYACYFGGGWGNYYLVLFYPDIWSYELFETYLNQPINPWSKKRYMYSTDYEGYEGRKTYADETAGGYYAARLSVLERMIRNKKQHAAVVLRFISPEYNIPLGVWVCREAARKSLNSTPVTFESEQEMITYCQKVVSKKFQFDINLLLQESLLLKKRKEQSKLTSFM
jgi:DNA repair protein NreA